MSQARTVTRLAVRELWVTLRLFVVLAAYVGAGAVVAFLPPDPTGTPARLAAGFGLATVVTSAVTAVSLALERGSGRAGWLVTRSVSRSTYLGGWFAALAAIAAAGIAAGVFLGWLALASAAVGASPIDYAIAIAIVAIAAAIGIAAGLWAGSLLRPSIAVSVVVLAAAALVVAAGIVTGGVFPSLSGAGDDLGATLRAIGGGLALTGVLLVGARLAFERADL